MHDLARRARVLALLLPLVACDQQGTVPDEGQGDATVATTSDPDSSATSVTTEDTSVATTPEDTSVATTSEDTSVATTSDQDTSVATTSVQDTSVTSVEDTTTTTVEDTTTPPDDVVVGPSSYTLNFGGWTMAPEDEDTWCVVKRLGNASPILVNRIRTQLSEGSHHLIVYRSNDTQEKATPFKCSPFVETLGGNTVPVAISQIREDVVQLPDNVGYEFGANQMVRLEAHYLNYYPDTITTNVDVHFDVIPDGDGAQRADILFYGNIGIYLVKDQVATLPWKFLSVPGGINIFAMTGHTHQYGTNVEVEKTTSRDIAGMSVYPPEGEPFEWDEAPVETFDPELQFANQEGFRFRCSYNNTSGGAVSFGESANKEMCFFWAYYYPSQGPIIRF